MGKVILIGGGKILNGKFEWLLKEIPMKSSILIIQSFSGKDQRWREILITFLKKILPKQVDYIDFKRSGGESIKKKIDNSRVIIVPGGKPDLLLKHIQRYQEQLKKWLKRKPPKVLQKKSR